MEISLKGRNALITGASQGLGRAMAERFASSGARVALVARSKENLDEAAAAIGDAAMAFPCDITDTDQLTQLYKDVEQKFGNVDILINNAGSSRRGSFLEVSDQDWQEDLDLKLFAAIRFGRHYMPGMMERKWGRVINVVSTAAKAQPGGSVPTSVTRAAGMSLQIYTHASLSSSWKCGRSSNELSRTFQSLFQSPPHLRTMPCWSARSTANNGQNAGGPRMTAPAISRSLTPWRKNPASLSGVSASRMNLPAWPASSCRMQPAISRAAPSMSTAACRRSSDNLTGLRESALLPVSRTLAGRRCLSEISSLESSDPGHQDRQCPISCPVIRQ